MDKTLEALPHTNRLQVFLLLPERLISLLDALELGGEARLARLELVT